MAKLLNLGDEVLSDEDWAFVWDEFPDEVALTPDQIEEIAACSVDCRYFIEQFCWLEEKETRSIFPFVPFDWQWEILERLQRGESIVGNKSRRVGASWIVAAYVAWLINFYEGVNVLFVSENEDKSKKLLRKVKFILNNLAYRDSDNIREATPATFLRGEVAPGGDNQTYFAIAYRDNDGLIVSQSEVNSLTTTSQSGRSEGASLVFWDEAAFAKPDDEATWSALGPTTLTRGGQVVIFSTPNGVGGIFWQLVREGEEGTNDWFHFMEIHWSQAGITQAQIDIIRSALKMTQEKFEQEFELKFTQSGLRVFDSTFLDACYKPIAEHPDIEELLVRYDETDGFYLSGADSFGGEVKKGQDPDYNSWVSITRSGITAYVEANQDRLGDWAGKMSWNADGSQSFVKGKVSNLHEHWPGILIIEKNQTGSTVVLNYVPPDDGVSSMIAATADVKSKPRIIEQLILAVEGIQCIITDAALYHEMYDMQRGSRPGQYEAPAGGHDDRVLAFAWAWDALLRYGGIDLPEPAKVSQPSRSSYTGILAATGLPMTEQMRVHQGTRHPMTVRHTDDVLANRQIPVPQVHSPRPDGLPHSSDIAGRSVSPGLPPTLSPKGRLR